MLFITYDSKVSIEQPYRQSVFNSICLISGLHRDSSLTLRMTRPAGRLARNAGSFLRWQSCIGLPSRAQLAHSLPIKGPSFCLPDRDGAGRSPEDRSENLRKRPDAPILRRLRRHPLPVEGGFCSTSCSTGDTKASPVTLTIYLSPPKAAIPQTSAQSAVKHPNPPAGRPVKL